MKRTKLKERALPKYTRGEEIFNMVTHIVGGAFGIIVTTLCIVFASIHKNIYGIISGSIYGFTMILLYTMSSIYHGLKPDTTSKKVFQILDHCTIYLLIAGTYTPFTLCTFREYNPTIGWTIFGIIWALAILGIILNSIDLKKYKVFSMICYIVMGWCVIFRIDIIIKVIGINGFILLLSGGISYTIGTIFFGLERFKKYMHSVFHLLILLGSILHFLCIILYVM